MTLFNSDRTKTGASKPAICISLTGKNSTELKAELELIKNKPHQLAEWRADYMIAAMAGKSFWAVTREILNTLGFLKSHLEVPVVFTIRTDGEGGAFDMAREDYFFINKMVSDSKMADIIDIEAFTAVGTDLVTEFLEYADRHNQMVLLSNHDFEKTPSLEEMVRKYEYMRDAGGDIIKLAVMPHDEEDVACLLSAAAYMNETYPETRLVAISMGELGMSSRICAGQFGSVITFAAGANASAPGQIDAETLKGYLDQYYK